MRKHNRENLKNVLSIVLVPLCHDILIYYRICLTCVILDVLKKLKVSILIKNNYYLLKYYIFNIKYTNLLFKLLKMYRFTRN